MVQNKGLIFKSVPTDWPVEGINLTIEDRGFDLKAEPPKDGITTKNYYLSFDPYQRGRMRAPEVASYSPPFALREPITNSAVSKVLKSKNKKFKEGGSYISELIFPVQYWKSSRWTCFGSERTF